jgi:hypothetical protein
MPIGLFSRLEQYSLNNKKSASENLFTELLAYSLETEEWFRRRLLERVFKDSPRLVRRYLGAEIRTQHALAGDSRVDLVFMSPRGNLHFENKIASQEGRTSQRGGPALGQVARYLGLLRDNDHLVYLTGSGASTPIFRRSARNQKIFAGHLYWDEIYGILNQRKPKANSHLQSLILDYMQENGMTPVEGFTKTNLREARSAFSYIKKSDRLLSLIWAEIGPDLEAWLGNNHSGSAVRHNGYADESLYCRHADKKNRLSIYLSVIIGTDGLVYLGFGPGTWKKQTIAAFESDEKVRAKCRTLQSLGWEKSSTVGWWEMNKYFRVKPKALEDVRDELVPKVRQAMRELKSSQLAHIMKRRSQWAE